MSYHLSNSKCHGCERASTMRFPITLNAAPARGQLDEFYFPGQMVATDCTVIGAQDICLRQTDHLCIELVLGPPSRFDLS